MVGSLYLFFIWITIDSLQISVSDSVIIQPGECSKLPAKQRLPREERYRSRRDGPGRDYYSRRINIRTRGEPDDYHTVGILRKEGTDDVVPLIGRQTYPGSNQWNYFTMTDSHLKTEIPLKRERSLSILFGAPTSMALAKVFTDGRGS